MSSQSKLRFEPQGWVARPDCFYVLPIAAKYLGAKDPSQLQQSLCQRSIALGASLTRPGCASSQCRHRPEPFVRRGMWLLLLPSLFFFLDGPSDSTGSSGRIREVKCSTFFSSGRWVQRDAVLTRPGRLRGEKLKCPFSNEINKPTQALSAQHSFPGVPSGLVCLCGQSYQEVTSCVSQVSRASRVGAPRDKGNTFLLSPQRPRRSTGSK